MLGTSAGLPAAIPQLSHGWGSLGVVTSWGPWVEWPKGCCKFRYQGKPLPGPKCTQRAEFSEPGLSLSIRTNSPSPRTDQAGLTLEADVPVLLPLVTLQRILVFA